MVREFSEEEIRRDNAAFSLLSLKDQETWMKFQISVQKNKVSEDNGRALNEATPDNAIEKYAESDITQKELDKACEEILGARDMLSRLGKIKQSLGSKPIGSG